MAIPPLFVLLYTDIKQLLLAVSGTFFLNQWQNLRRIREHRKDRKVMKSDNLSGTPTLLANLEAAA